MTRPILRMPPAFPDEKIRQVRINTKWEAREPAFVERIGLQIIKDIEPYAAVGGDVALGGAAPKIGSRREHKEFLKRNKYIEVGNQEQRQRKQEFHPVAPDLRRALEEVKSRR